MTIHYEITQKDFVNFNLYYIENSNTQRKNYLSVRILIPLVFSVLLFIMGTILFNQPVIYWTIISMGIFGLWFLYFPKQYHNLIAKEAEKKLSKGSFKNMLGEKNMHIDEVAITITGDKQNEKVKVEDIETIEQYKDMIIIYYSDKQVIIVPTRSLSWEEIRIVSILK
ncbi:MAG TPA: hypothetical protein DCO62_03375 [Alkalibacterium sp.]|uniref:YcxB-like protein n=1 Tax=Alkalibacterium gilvum TaxID=1130080 RepID=A0A1H6UTD3_9LACT|nr:YcxB family protein [Alkalibacterium gilvum]SEI95471.1 YcxB-like protein [Alkalibacterium gilvum]HAJ70250.1 hypothetical protein [Alkalibacterium sp.]